MKPKNKIDKINKATLNIGIHKRNSHKFATRQDRQQYLNNHRIYYAIFKLKTEPIFERQEIPLATKKRKEIKQGISNIIDSINWATQNGCHIPNLIIKIIMSEISNHLNGKIHPLSWAYDELRKEGKELQSLIDNPNKRVKNDFYDRLQINHIYDGFIDARALKNGTITSEEMNSKYYRKRSSRQGYSYGYKIGMNKAKLVQRNFLEYFQEDMCVGSDTVKEQLVNQDLWELIRDIVKASKNINKIP